jgi:hypothetical protein
LAWLLSLTAMAIAAQRVSAADVRMAGPAMAVPAGASLTALPDGRLIIFGEGTTSIWNPVGRHWETDMRANGLTRRSAHTATLDGAGRLVFTGGLDAAGYRGRQNALNSSSVWNYGPNTWEAGPGLLEPRIAHAAVALKSHEILVTGGSSSADGDTPVAPMLASVELLGEKTTVKVAPMAAARALHAALLLADGRVLVSGGIGDDAAALRSTDIYDPATRSWRRGPDLRQARFAHRASLLPDGRVLIAGGFDSKRQPLSSTEVWRPGEPQWQDAGELHEARAAHGATVLPSGEVLISGGETLEKRPAQVLERWRDGAGGWRNAGHVPLQLHDAHAVLTANGRLLLFGRDPYAGSVLLAWLPDAQDDPSVDAPMAGVLTPMADGRFMLTGGFRRQFDSSAADIYDPATRQWTGTAPLHRARRGHRALGLRDGRVLVLGGHLDGRQARDDIREAPGFAAEIWNPATGNWELSHSLAYDSGSWQEPALMANGRVALSAVDSGNQYSPIVAYQRVWNPADDSVGPLVTLNRPWQGGQGILLADGRILYAGGDTPNERRMDVYEPGGDGWQPLPAAPFALTGLIFQALADGGVAAWPVNAGAGTGTGTGSANSAAPLLRWHRDSGWQALSTPARWPTQPSLQAFSLPRGDLLLMANGRDSWIWNGVGQQWIHIAHDQSWDSALLVAAAPAGSVLGFHAGSQSDSAFARLAASRLNPALARWEPDNGEYVPRAHPTLVDLGKGRVMVAGGGTRVVQVWTAARNSWQLTGHLNRPLEAASATKLPDGRVMLAGIAEEGMGHALYCELWTPASGEWSECGRFVVDAAESREPTLLRALDDGRVLLVHGRQHALLWTEAQGWSATKMQMADQQGIANVPPAGTPYLAPLGSVWDAAGNRWLDATDAFFINSLRMRAVVLRDGGVLAIASAGRVYRWDPKAKLLSSLQLRPAPEDSALTALVETTPGCIAAWNDTRQQSLPFAVQATVRNVYAGDLQARRWGGNADIALTPLNASGIGLADGTVLIAGNSLLSNSAADAMQRFRIDCKGVTALDEPSRLYLPTVAVTPPATPGAGAGDEVQPFHAPPFPQRWLGEVRSQVLALPQLWLLKVLAALAVLWPLMRYAQRWETYVEDDAGRLPGRRNDILVLAVTVPSWIALIGLPNHALKTCACLLLGLAAFISARRLWLNASDARHKGIIVLPLAAAWFMALATVGSVFTSGVTRWFAFLTDYS